MLSPAKKINSLVLGLDNSGKTTTLYGLRLEQVTKQVGEESVCWHQRRGALLQLADSLPAVLPHSPPAT